MTHTVSHTYVVLNSILKHIKVIYVICRVPSDSAHVFTLLWWKALASHGGVVTASEVSKKGGSFSRSPSSTLDVIQPGSRDGRWTQSPRMLICETMVAAALTEVLARKLICLRWENWTEWRTKAPLHRSLQGERREVKRGLNLTYSPISIVGNLLKGTVKQSRNGDASTTDAF